MKSHVFSQFVFAFSPLILLAVIAMAQVPPPPPTTVAPAPSDSKATTGKRGSITGRVLGEDGQPLEGATVLAMAMNGVMSNRSGTSDEEGNFKLQNLPAAAYIVTASVPGYVSTQGSMLEAMTSNTKQRYRIGESVTLTMVKGGAITGKVLDAAGQPLVGAQVWVARVRDAEGRAINEVVSGRSNEAVTGRVGWSDDRGVYRVYGLQAGSYVAYTMGAGDMFSSLTGSREVPTYHPNATRDTAQEVSVSAGMEVQGIDIRHRGELGHAVSGTIAGAAENASGMMNLLMVELLQAGTGNRVGTANVNMASSSGFAMYGVSDGEYDLTALQRVVNMGQRVTTDSLASAPRRVTVRGGDVTGIELRLTALSSIAGQVVLEKIAQTTCQITRRGDLEELLLLPQREDKETRRGTLAALVQDVTPNDKGEFIVRDLDAGRYRLNPQLPSDHWYVKAMNVGAAAPARPAARTIVPSIVASGIALKSGEKFSGVTITLAEGAAALSGRLDGKKQAARLRVHVVPAEADAVSDVLRYYEVVTRDGAFTFGNLAPGKYWFIARAVPEDESDEKPAKPAAWDVGERTKLRRAAEAANQAITLTTCQRAKDFVLKFEAVVK